MLKSELVNCLKCRNRAKKNGWSNNWPDPSLSCFQSHWKKSCWCFIMIKWLECGGRFNKCVHYDMTQRETTQLCCRLKCEVHQQMLLSSMMNIWRLHYFPLWSHWEYWQNESCTCFLRHMKWFCCYKNKKTRSANKVAYCH